MYLDERKRHGVPNLIEVGAPIFFPFPSFPVSLQAADHSLTVFVRPPFKSVTMVRALFCFPRSFLPSCFFFSVESPSLSCLREIRTFSHFFSAMGLLEVDRRDFTWRTRCCSVILQTVSALSSRRRCGICFCMTRVIFIVLEPMLPFFGGGGTLDTPFLSSPFFFSAAAGRVVFSL